MHFDLRSSQICECCQNNVAMPGEFICSDCNEQFYDYGDGIDEDFDIPAEVMKNLPRN